MPEVAGIQELDTDAQVACRGQSPSRREGGVNAGSREPVWGPAWLCHPQVRHMGTCYFREEAITHLQTFTLFLCLWQPPLSTVENGQLGGSFFTQLRVQKVTFWRVCG